MKNNLSSVDATPLDWPDPNRWPRTKNPVSSRFHSYTSGGRKRNRTVAESRNFVMEELNRLGAGNIVISTNLPLRKSDGLPYKNAAEPDDSGAAVYFMLDGNPRCIPCDKWDRVADNLYAIGKTIEAMRGIDRWGTPQIIAAAFSGFKALPEHAGGAKWWKVLGVEQDARGEKIKKAFREKVKQTHPDRGGSIEALTKVREAYRQAQQVADQ